jgi:hypothetical protein
MGDIVQRYIRGTETNLRPRWFSLDPKTHTPFILIFMRFSPVLFSLALSVGLAVAGPVADASTPAISVVKGVKTPEFTEVESHV